MNREETVLRVLAMEPLQHEALLEVIGCDRQATQQALNQLLGAHRIYKSRGYYVLNRPERRAVRQPTLRYIPTATQAQPLMLQAVW